MFIVRFVLMRVKWLNLFGYRQRARAGNRLGGGAALLPMRLDPSDFFCGCSRELEATDAADRLRPGLILRNYVLRWSKPNRHHVPLIFSGTGQLRPWQKGHQEEKAAVNQS